MPKEKEIFWVSDLKKEIRKFGLTLHEVSDGQYVFVDKDTGEVIAPSEGEWNIFEVAQYFWRLKSQEQKARQRCHSDSVA